MKFETLLITPSVAREILEKNIVNRRVNQPKLSKYYEDMVAGRWHQGIGDTIRLSKTNRMLDGQHRLLALIRANVSLVMTICSGLDDDAIFFIDTGKSRNAADAFKIAGISNESKIPSAITYFERLKKGYAISGGYVSFTNFQLIELYNEKPEYWQNVIKKSHVWYHAFTKIVPPSFIAGMYAYFQSKHGSKADVFMDMVFKGVDIGNNAIVLLRGRMIQDALSKSKISAEYKGALFIKAWNFYLQNKDCKTLKYTPEVESYPIAK